MPKAIQHDAIKNFPDLGLVLLPGIEAEVTAEQAVFLAAHGITILPGGAGPSFSITRPAAAPPEPTPETQPKEA